MPRPKVQARRGLTERPRRSPNEWIHASPLLRSLVAFKLSDLDAKPTGVLNEDQREAPGWPGGPVFDEEGRLGADT